MSPAVLFSRSLPPGFIAQPNSDLSVIRQSKRATHMSSIMPHKSFPVSWDEFHRDSRALAWRLNHAGPFRAIVTITRGGLVPANAIGMVGVDVLAASAADSPPVTAITATRRLRQRRVSYTKTPL
jgi:hypothetical protein